MREPSANAIYDTLVHFVVEGLSVRVANEPDRQELEAVASVVRAEEAKRRSDRRRSRAVPIYLGETNRVLSWVDVFD